ncbi:S-formylglutathione hydrolase FrmB [Thermomonospora echinospora]|uniref:Acyl-CoA:diacylglycerol acyltransferase n=1 Tax=Thermomonospora echinospora TaxID=1992 RepID=A0A1H6CEP7_9ACTN|nr:alpha/beta hydrolase-fold protein [Thermomonospora echinospora]SEG71481.1 S-formylglutathione hydrolase FrmB [Thermomonospora echinospora]
MPARSRRRLTRRVGAITAAAIIGPLAMTAATGPVQAATYKRASNGATVAGVKWIKKGSQFDITINSKALGAKAKVRVLVPKTWKRTAKRTWPVLYAYHGGRDSYLSWTRSTDIEGMARKYDVMVVMPAGNNGSYTNWWNDGRGGKPMWETFHTLEVRELVERNFRAGGARACMGNSSGGQGCVTYAARFPKMFRHAASFSGPLSILSPGLPSLLLYTMSGTPGVDPYDVYGDPIIDRANWKAHDPASLASKLRGTKLYISSGTTGQPGPYEKPGMAPWDVGLTSEKAIGYSNQVFLNKARQLKLPVTANLYGNGRHSWPYWIRESNKVWPTLMKSLGARRF